VKRTSYHESIQASEQHNDVAGQIFKYHAYCTAMPVIQKYVYVVSKSTVIVEEMEGKGKLAVVFGGLRETM